MPAIENGKDIEFQVSYIDNLITYTVSAFLRLDFTNNTYSIDKDRLFSGGFKFLHENEPSREYAIGEAIKQAAAYANQMLYNTPLSGIITTANIFNKIAAEDLFQGAFVGYDASGFVRLADASNPDLFSIGFIKNTYVTGDANVEIYTEGENTYQSVPAFKACYLSDVPGRLTITAPAPTDIGYIVQLLGVSNEANKMQYVFTPAELIA